MTKAISMLDCESAPENGGDLKQESLRKSQKKFTTLLDKVWKWCIVKLASSKRTGRQSRCDGKKTWKKFWKAFDKTKNDAKLRTRCAAWWKRALENRKDYGTQVLMILENLNSANGPRRNSQGEAKHLWMIKTRKIWQFLNEFKRKFKKAQTN